MQNTAYQTSAFVGENVANGVMRLEARTLRHLPGLIGDLTVWIQNFTTNQSAAATDLNLDLEIQISALLFPVKLSICRVITELNINRDDDRGWMEDDLMQ